MTAFERLRDAIAVTLKVPPATITESAASTDIPTWDSVGHVNVMMAVEQTFGLVLDVEDFARLDSVGAIVAYLREQGVT